MKTAQNPESLEALKKAEAGYQKAERDFFSRKREGLFKRAAISLFPAVGAASADVRRVEDEWWETHVLPFRKARDEAADKCHQSQPAC